MKSLPSGFILDRFDCKSDVSGRYNETSIDERSLIFAQTFQHNVKRALIRVRVILACIILHHQTPLIFLIVIDAFFRIGCNHASESPLSSMLPATVPDPAFRGFIGRKQNR